MYKNKQAFTLIELLIVIGIIAILAAAVVVAINPGQQFAAARDATRESHVNSIQNALLSYQVDSRGTLPTEIKDNPGAEICNLQALAENESCPTDTIDLSPLVPEYISSLPINPSKEETDTGIGYGVASVGNEFAIWPTESETRLVGRRPALKFDGGGDYGRINEHSPVSELEGTVSTWVKLDSINKDQIILIGGESSASGEGDQSEFFIMYDNDLGNFNSGWTSSGGENDHTCGNPETYCSINPKDQEWYHLTHTYDVNNGQTIFINGEKQGGDRAHTTNSKTGWENGLILGQAMNNATSLKSLNGFIDDVRIYNRALSEEEVEALYNGQNITTGLVGHWPLNEGQGGVAYDESGNGNDGTLMPNYPDNNPEWTIGK